LLAVEAGLSSGRCWLVNADALAHDLTPSPALAAVVTSGDAAGRRHATRLLKRAGFAVSVGTPPEGAAKGSIVVMHGAGDGVARVREVRARAQADPHALILAVMPSDVSNVMLRRALVAGAAGIVLEPDVERALVVTAHALLAGQLAVPESLARQIAPRPLSHREKQILGHVVQGLTNREIGQRLFLAESTVKTHLSSAFRKIDARSRSEAVARIQDPEAGLGPGILSLVEGATPAYPAPALLPPEEAFGAGR
jgi:DNA-binding NarL/FixJ family response regulator